jgi:hypothetical protein
MIEEINVLWNTIRVATSSAFSPFFRSFSAVPLFSAFSAFLYKRLSFPIENSA